MARRAGARDGVAELNPFAGLRCLVLGGGGFLGTNLCRALRDAGAEVAAFGRSRVDAAALDGVAWHQGGWPATPPPLAGVDTVFDLIGAGLPARADVAATATAMLALTEACRRADVARIVFASSGGAVYGVAGTVAETAPTEPISRYGVAKLTAEKLLALAERQGGPRHAVARIANPYGPYQDGARGQGLIAAVARDLSHGRETEIWGDGTVVRDYVHVDDVVAALLLLATTTASEHRVYNVGSGTGRRVLDVVGDFGRVAGRTPRTRLRPARPADVPVNILDCARLRGLGWRPRVGWEEGLSRVWRSEHREHAAVDVEHLAVDER